MRWGVGHAPHDFLDQQAINVVFYWCARHHQQDDCVVPHPPSTVQFRTTDLGVDLGNVLRLDAIYDEVGISDCVVDGAGCFNTRIELLHPPESGFRHMVDGFAGPDECDLSQMFEVEADVENFA